MSGTLFVVATPLGNLGDLSPRAVEILGSVSGIACEDTRRTAKLLARYAIRTRTISCHQFNERARIEPLIERLLAGADLALVSDGGTPGIADPGALLVAAARSNGICVSPVPGPSAISALLSASGLPADRYVFDGFLPHRAGERRTRLHALRGEIRTVVVYETPHRIRAALADVSTVLGQRPLVLGRELTKAHEQLLAGSAREIAARLDSPVRGEIVLAIAGASAADVVDDTADGSTRIATAHRAALEQSGGDSRRALRLAARALGLDRAELQRRLDEMRSRK